jgi:hypothetical protein
VRTDAPQTSQDPPQPVAQVESATDLAQGTPNAAIGTTAEATPQPLQAIDTLSGESDYLPFMAKDVAPELRNQAMKKLFTDPHYNIMDGLDIYIDDYGKPDPLPAGWLEKMNQSKSLRLFETPAEEAARYAEQNAEPKADLHGGNATANTEAANLVPPALSAPELVSVEPTDTDAVHSTAESAGAARANAPSERAVSAPTAPTMAPSTISPKA